MIKLKNNSRLFINYLVIILVFVILGFVIYLINARKTVEKTNIGEVIPVNEQIKPDTLPNPFDFNKAIIGDVSSGFEIVKISSYNGDQIPLIDNLTVSFKNKKMIGGKIEAYDTGPLQGKICMYNDDPYAQKTLPRVVGDNRLLFFCFNNVEKAKTLVSNSKVGESINVTIENYTINLDNNSAVNTADLSN